MSLSKRLLKWLPETYFLIILNWWLIGTFLGQKSIDNSILINYPALIFIAAIILQFVIKNKHLGITIASLLVLGTLLLSLTIVSDAILAPSFDARTAKFFMYGSILVGLNFFMSIRMFYKYSKMPNRSESNDIPLGI